VDNLHQVEFKHLPDSLILEDLAIKATPARISQKWIWSTVYAMKNQMWDNLGSATTKGLGKVLTFWLFVTGYAAFFNEGTTQCDDITLERCVAPAPLCWFDVSTTLTWKFRRNLDRLVTNLNSRPAAIV
jgi:hypothetical protein